MKKILTSKEIGEKLKQFRKNRGVTQEQLAEEIDVSFQQIQQYENGTSRLNTDRLQAIAFALSVPIAAFFEEKEVECTLSEDEHKLINGFRALSNSEVRTFVLSSLAQMIGKNSQGAG